MSVADCPETVTTTFLAPAAPAGDVHVSEEALATETPVAEAPPIVTVVAPLTKFVPVMVTLVPPAVVPVDGEIDATVGAGAT